MSKMTDRHILHGAAFAQLLDAVGEITISRKTTWHDHLYSLRRGATNALVILKYATRPRSPWQFTFSADEEEAMVEVGPLLRGHVRYFALICARDGVCCVSEGELRGIVPGGLARKAVSVSRPRDSSYRVNGPGGNTLGRKVPRTDWPMAIFSPE